MDEGWLKAGMMRHNANSQKGLRHKICGAYGRKPGVLGWCVARLFLKHVLRFRLCGHSAVLMLSR
jgi:hypothetical protein